jgi:hypothetical protein
MVRGFFFGVFYLFTPPLTAPQGYRIGVSQPLEPFVHIAMSRFDRVGARAG